MRWGHLLTPWRLLRHSLFIAGLALTIAVAAVVTGVVLQGNDGTTYPKTSASSSRDHGESTSIGALTRWVKSPGSVKAASADGGPESAATTATAEPEATAGASEGVSAEEGAASEARVSTALTNEVPMLAERPADQGDMVVSAARFKVKSTPTVSEATTRTQVTAPTAQDMRPGDELTVPVTFYYCEDSTGGQRRGDGGGFCGLMRDGTAVYPGAAACDVVYLGQRFRIEGDPTGRTYVCADTGSAIHGQHRDIWFMSSGEGWAWQQVVGRSAVIQVLP